MSVRTTADEKRDTAKDHIKMATKNLSEIIVDKVWGSDEFSLEYENRLLTALFDLLKIQASI